MDALGVGGARAVLGPLAPAAIERLFRAADVFAFPSVKEGFGLAALEALAAELPVVASDLDVFRGFLTDGESALLAPTGDGAALAAALGAWRRAGAARPAARGRAAGGRRATPGTRRRPPTSARTSVPVEASVGAMSALAVSARWDGGPRRRCEARGHRLAVDEPVTPAARTTA